MKTKNVILSLALASTLGLGVITVSTLVDTRNNDLLKADQTTYTVTLNAANSPSNLTSDFNSEEITAVPSRYAEMGYLQAKKATGSHAVLSQDGGTIRNITSIDVNITSLTVTFTGGTLTLKAGYSDTTDWSIALTSGEAATFEGNRFAVVASVGDVTITSLSYTYTCTAIPTPSNEVSNLAVTFADGDYDTVGTFTVAFDSYTGADKYIGALSRGGTVIEKKTISSGDTFTATKQTTTGTNEGYSFAITAYSGTSHKALTKATAATMNVYYRNAFVDGNSNKWDCYTVDGAPFSTTKFTYANGMNYVGAFNSDFQFDGEGMFSWSTNGKYSGGNAWKGHWTNGVWDLDVAGTFYYPQNWTHPYDGLLHYMDCKESAVGTPNFTTVTAGKYMWDANDTYVGEMAVTAQNAWKRNGLGHQYDETLPLYTAGDWHTSTYNDGNHAELVNRLAALSETNGTLRCGGFYGKFISSSDWISGDGCNVWYANDGVTPVAYITGTYSGKTTRSGPYTGETATIMPGFESATDLTFYW